MLAQGCSPHAAGFGAGQEAGHNRSHFAPGWNPLWPVLSPDFKAQHNSHLTSITNIKSAITVIISGGMKHFWLPGGHRAWPGAPGLPSQASVFTLPPLHLSHAWRELWRISRGWKGPQSPHVGLRQSPVPFCAPFPRILAPSLDNMPPQDPPKMPV